jgi:putative SOS response-associated peptidase YedK
MCGRFTLRRIDLALEEMRKLGIIPGSVKYEEFWKGPRYNVAPSQAMPVVRVNSAGQIVIEPMSWGLIPSWTKDKPKLKPINAKSETVATGGMFRQAFQRRRCLVPADGFYEWKGAKPPKQPYFIHTPDDGQFAFAGLWERWRGAAGSEPLDTFTILTTAPNELMATIHNRMPVILKPGDYEKWLDAKATADQLKPLLAPLPENELEAYPVFQRVNSPKNDDPACIEPVGA